MIFPSGLFYTKDHEWVLKQNTLAANIGITDFAQNELGDIVYVDINTVGRRIAAEEVYGSIESVKTVSDLFAPVACTIVELNKNLEYNPALINSDPYGEGWLIKIKPENPNDIDQLMHPLQYRKLVGELGSIVEELVYIMYLDESGKIHCVPALRGEDGQISIQAKEINSLIISSFVSAENLAKQHIIEEFEYLLNKQGLKEYEMQKFFEEHPEFLLGIDYETLHPQVILQSEESTLKPDFILKPIAGVSYGPNIVELKMPGLRIEKMKERREGLYANIHEAADQLRAYARYFDEKANREYVKNKLGFTAYRPTLTLIIGKKIEVGDEKLRAALLDSINPIQLLTYQDVLLKYKAMIKKL